MFDITQDGDRWECRPAGLWAHFGAIFMLFGAGFCLFIAGKLLSQFPDGASLAISAVPLFAAILVGWQAWRYWRLRGSPLTIEGSGRVSYDGKELCPSGSVRSVQIVPDPRAESGDCKVVFETNDGNKVELEAPYFGSVTRREVARVLAGELAKALKVDVVET